MLGDVSIIGYAGRDAELRYTPQGTPYCQFSVGMTEHFKVEGERRERLTWYNCKVWGARAESLFKYIRKGSHLFVEGRVTADAYIDRETGEAKAQIIIGNARRVQLLDRRAENGDQSIIDDEADAIVEEASTVSSGGQSEFDSAFDVSV